MAKYKTPYGYFSDDGKEYVITDYKTPKPWVNVISNGDYGLVISQTGGGFSWKTHSEFNRLNRWHQDLIQDNWGKYFYLRNDETGETWSPTWMPVKTAPDTFLCRYGSGYCIFETEYKGIKVQVRIFVPLNDSLEVWEFSVTNNTGNNIHLSLFSYFEWCLGSSADHHREFHKSFIETEYDQNLNALLGRKRLWEVPVSNRGHWNIEYPFTGFISADTPIVDYDGDKEAFIGNYGSLQDPQALKTGKLTKLVSKWNDSVAVIKLELTVEAGATKQTAVFMGIAEDKPTIQKSTANYSTPEQREDAFQQIITFWNELLSPLEIDTPDEAMNFLVNRWLRYQAIAGRLWGRTAYYQQSGAFGFRDQLQDSLVFLPISPDLTEKQIRLHARHQKKDGSVLHWWHPISDTGLETQMTDDLLWLPFIITHYLEETVNYAILDAAEPWYDDKTVSNSLFDHCDAAIEKVLSRYSERGLPLIGAGDWNDGLSAVGLDMKGESIWLAEFFYTVLLRFAQVCDDTSRNEKSAYYKEKAAALKLAFDAHAWDGEWYFRATKDNGTKIGSNENSEGKIYLNAQIWSVISGIGEPDKQNAAMAAVSKHLLKNFGPLLLTPAYSIPDQYIGYLSRYAPGRRENGGVYTHAATWAIWAYSMQGDRANAFEVYRRLNPINNGMNPNKYVCEPYVTPGNIDGPESPNYGMGGWTWYTGSASWFQKMIVDWILGVRAHKDGLLISPCVPDGWTRYSVKRKFRGTSYNITVHKSEGTYSRVSYMLIDGVRSESNLIGVSSKAMSTVEVFLE